MASESLTVGQVQENVCAALRELIRLHELMALPSCLEPLAQLLSGRAGEVTVSLLKPDSMRQIKRTASSATLDNGFGLWITAEHGHDAAAPEADESTNQASPSPDDDRFAPLIRAQSKAEQTPHLHFVALKHLRDRLLVDEMPALAEEPQARQSLVADAIREGILSTSKKPNPRAPQYPTTAVTLNRSHPLVARILKPLPDERRDFAPIAIRGQPLSKTILEDRR
jgi:hypothetical protein